MKLILLSLLIVSTAYGQKITKEAVRLLPPTSKATGAFFILENDTKKDFKLIKAHSHSAKATEVHTHLKENGVMKMREVKEVLVKAGDKKIFMPGGHHIMLMGLKSPLKEGEKIDIELEFDNGKKITINPEVKKVSKQDYLN